MVPELKVNPKEVLQVDSIKLKPNHDLKKKSVFKHGTQFQARDWGDNFEKVDKVTCLLNVFTSE